jgi:hypothetical protein
VDCWATAAVSRASEAVFGVPCLDRKVLGAVSIGRLSPDLSPPSATLRPYRGIILESHFALFCDGRKKIPGILANDKRFI